MEDVFLIEGPKSSTVAPLSPDGYYIDNVAEAYATEGTIDILPEDQGEPGGQFVGKVLRVIDDRLFVVHPGPPPEAQSA